MKLNSQNRGQHIQETERKLMWHIACALRSFFAFSSFTLSLAVRFSRGFFEQPIAFEMPSRLELSGEWFLLNRLLLSRIAQPEQKPDL